MSIVDNYPEKGKELLESKGREVIQQIGKEAVKEAVLSILSGENIRSSTEFITRRRLAISNGALLITFLKSCRKDRGFLAKMPEKAAKELKTAKTKNEKWILQWLLGLTDKAVQNVLRDDIENIEEYEKKLSETLKGVVSTLEKDYGKLDGTLTFENKEFPITWKLMAPVFSAIGSQTLTLRGSEKSTYGKLFEKLVLGSLLEILGFKMIDPDNPPKQLKKVFWLSRTEKRESDATLIVSPGKGVRFDIGFIGRGNPEISLDKVTRFDREMTSGKQTHYMGTYIVVDRVGENSKIESLARDVNGEIIQMSLAYWPRRVAELLKRDANLRHPIIKMKDGEAGEFIKKSLNKVDLMKYVNYP